MAEVKLVEESISPDPFIQFEIWYGEHLEAGIDIPETAFLGTASATARVSLRTVLLKEYSRAGFTFFTNYNSRKSREILANRIVALLFYWPEKGRQVRIEGNAEKVLSEVSDAYFMKRPRESQLSAWASEQSSVIPGRKSLEERFQFYENLYKGKEVPRPDHWGGFRIVPDMFEFWQDREHRLHDRIVYTLNNDKWVIRRLSP